MTALLGTSKLNSSGTKWRSTISRRAFASSIAQRLILANRRYAEIYNLPAGSVRPGMTLGEVVDLRFAAGTFPNMTREEYLAWRAAIAISDQSNDSIVELKSGQVISIHHRPMPDGGWVSTHEDVTERRRVEKRLATWHTTKY